MKGTLENQRRLLRAREQYDTPESKRLRFEAVQAERHYNLIAREYLKLVGERK